MNALESLSDDLLKWDFCDYILHKYQESLTDFFVCVFYAQIVAFPHHCPSTHIYWKELRFWEP